MSRYPFPNVPNVPGVPQVARSSAFPNTTPPRLGTALALGRLVLAFLRSPGWGIFVDHSQDPPERDPETGEAIQTVTVDKSPPVLVPDSFRDFGISNEFTIVTAPVEQGGFAAYNKVNNPFEVQLRLTKGGSLRERTEFLQKVDEIARSLQLYKIVTPERTYLGCNISRYEVSRKEAKGAYFLSEVDIFFQEIRTVVSEYTNTTFNTTTAKQASDTPIQNGGVVQAVAQ